MRDSINNISMFLDSLNICYLLHKPENSVYIKLIDVIGVKQIRFSNHEGRKTSRNSWEVRSDRETKRQNKIFNCRDIKLMKSLLSLKFN